MESYVHRWKLDDVEALLPGDAQQGRRYAEPFNHGSMRLGLYAPRGHDPQQPHDQDELYVVQSGSGMFVCDQRECRFGPGDVLFVPAHAAHRFESFTDDFKAWVVFWGPPGGENEP